MTPNYRQIYQEYTVGSGRGKRALKIGVKVVTPGGSEVKAINETGTFIALYLVDGRMGAARSFDHPAEFKTEES